MPDATAVATALAFVRAINARNPDALAALMTEDHEFIDSGGDAWQGRAVMRKNWQDYFRLFPDYAITLHRVAPHEGRVVLRGASSGALSAYGQEALRRSDGTLPANDELQGPAIWTAQVQATGLVGKLSQWRAYDDTPDNRAALGLKVAATPVVIADYDPAWPDQYESLHAAIALMLGKLAVSIEHIGSTSVPGLAAKPTIDILVGVETLDKADLCVPLLVSLGYTYAPGLEDEMPFRRYFSMAGSGNQPGVHIHLVETSHRFYQRHLDFRDYLRAHAEAAAEYGALKRRLAEQYGDDRGGYTDAKTAFITDIEAKAQKWRQNS